MLVYRWQAPMTPTKEQIKRMLEGEGLEPHEENFPPNTKISDHRHPFNEVRIVAEGEILFNVGATQLLLRAGDRIEVPANTKHGHTTQANTCSCICAQKPF